MATTLDDVSEVVNQVIQEQGVSSASHVISAYRVSDGDKLLANFDSDGDHGLGLELLKTLRARNETNVVCLTIRTCSPNFRHLGRKRFNMLMTQL